MGPVADIFTEDVLAKLRGTLAIGHTRYSTAGDSALLNAQPIIVQSNKGMMAVAHNGNLVNARNSRTAGEPGLDFSDEQRHRSHRSPDRAVEGTYVARGHGRCSAPRRRRVLAGHDQPRPRFRGARSARIPAARHGAHSGARPEHDTIVFASETCAFDLIGADYVRDVKPGKLIIVGRKASFALLFAPAPQSSCIFEHVYFSRPDSLVFGRSVQESREELGRQLAREAPVEADLVVPVPDSGVTAAIGYAAESGIPFRFGLIRNHYVGRTFIEPQPERPRFRSEAEAQSGRSLLEGKRVVLIDDSIVRGTTSRKIVRMVRNAGAKEVHMRISCPPTISPCYYGVDTPTRKN